MDEIWTVEEVATWLKLSPATVRRLAGLGKIAGYKFGGEWRFSSEALKQHLSDGAPAFQDRKASARRQRELDAVKRELKDL